MARLADPVKASSNRRRIAALSLDLDNEWSYLQTRGDKQWTSFPSYLATVIPRSLDFLAERGIKLTVFVVGRDAEVAEHQAPLRAIADAGHEIANHSHHHRPWLHEFDKAGLNDDIGRAEEAIYNATGCRAVGFRGPGYSVSVDVLRVLSERGYSYDASTLPTFIGPVARAIFLARSDLSTAQKVERSRLFGGVKNGFKPINPYRLQIGNTTMVELPVTTLPLFRVPFHFSYLLSLAEYSPWVSSCYLNTALALCSIRGVEPSLLLHPLDFLDETDSPRLAFFPGMRIPWRKKIDLLHGYLERIQARHEIVSLREHALLAVDRGLPSRTLEESGTLRRTAETFR